MSQQEQPLPDPRAIAFCSESGPEVFSSVAYAHQVWERDPYDVVSVHAGARRAFARLVDAAVSRRGGGGRMLLVRGDAGSGKTHLVRAFRNHVHGSGLGFVGYLQMTSATTDYAQYTLTNLIDSLQKPYDRPDVETSGLTRLSDALAQLPGALHPDRLAALAVGEGGDDPVSPLVDDLLRHPGLSTFDPDLLRALMHLQRRDPAVSARAVKVLRCQPLADWDRRLLGGIPDRTGDGAALQTLVDLARLIDVTTGGCLVLLVDQLEDIANLDEASERFPRIIDVLRAVVDGAPNVVVVISCLDDMYVHVRERLARPALDRLEVEPPPSCLDSRRDLDEIEAIVQRRLAVLYEAHDVPRSRGEPLFPLSREALEPLTHLRTRDVVHWCYEYRQRCLAAGRLVPAAEAIVRPPPEPIPAAFDGTQRFNDFRAAFAASVPDDDESLLDLLAAAAVQCDIETGGETGIQALPAGDDLLTLQLSGPDGSPERYVVAICNQTATGGALTRRIDALEARAAPDPLVLVRSGPFPENPRTRIARRLGRVVKAGGRRLVIEESDWRTILAFDQFRAEQGHAPGYAQWVRAERPLSQLSSLRALFGLTGGPVQPAAPQLRAVPSTPRVVESDAPPPPPEHLDRDQRDPLPAGTVRLGRRHDSPGDVGIPLAGLVEHLGILGSGATAVAMRIVEQALVAGVPVLCLDRTGALAAFADPATAKRALPAGTTTVLYTPGAAGRPPGLGLLPAVEGLRNDDVSQLARQAAASIGALMGYQGTSRERSRLAILARAMGVLAPGGGEVRLDAIRQRVQDLDPELLHAVGHAKAGLYHDLSRDLDQVSESWSSLVHASPPLDVESHLATAGALAVMSTRLLGPEAAEFCAARVISELSAWCLRQDHGAADAESEDGLRGLLVIDEADLVLPDGVQPATLEPLGELLRRGRAAGLGVILASRAPGELEIPLQHVSRWLVGHVEDPRVLDHLAPVLSGRAVDVPPMLASLPPYAFVLLHDAAVDAVQVDPPRVAPRAFTDEELLALAAGPPARKRKRRS